MKIKVFKNYKDYIKNKKPYENGVSREFANKYGPYYKLTNCTNCYDCYDCTNCINCFSSERLVDCEDCDHCDSLYEAISFLSNLEI